MQHRIFGHCLACSIGHLVPACQPSIGSSFQQWTGRSPPRRGLRVSRPPQRKIEAVDAIVPECKWAQSWRTQTPIPLEGPHRQHPRDSPLPHAGQQLNEQGGVALVEDRDLVGTCCNGHISLRSVVPCVVADDMKDDACEGETGG
jgi:hypothetical protein